MGACKSKSTSREAKYFFKEVEDSAANVAQENSGQGISSQVKLTISLLNVSGSGNYKVEFIVYQDSKKQNGRNMGSTEEDSKSENDSISFVQFFSMVYYFEKQQPLTFRVYSGSTLLESVDTTLGSIMGSRRQIFKQKLSSGEELNVAASEFASSSKYMQFDVSVNGNLKGTELAYIIKSLGTIDSPSQLMLYKSENVYPVGSVTRFKNSQIPLNYLAPNNKLESSSAQIEITDIKHRESLGTLSKDIQNMLTAQNVINMKNNNRATVSCKLVNKPSFIAYLKSGMQINLTIGIDFTGSNGHPKDSWSLHYLSDKMNDYEKAIRSCGDIVAHYDADQLFPVFGFGFVSKNSTIKNTGRYNTFNYPINENTSDPNIHLIDNVLSTYRTFLNDINLSGPTHFAPLIKDLNRTMREELAEGKIMNYNILMILTDGQIDDMQETKNALVEASFLPCSVIIIGIGNGNFDNMDILDADENPLYDSSGTKADRDLVQFVPFNKFKDNAEKLAEEVLEEVPRQVVEYYQHQKINPKE